MDDFIRLAVAFLVGFPFLFWMLYIEKKGPKYGVLEQKLVDKMIERNWVDRNTWWSLTRWGLPFIVLLVVLPIIMDNVLGSIN